MINPIVGRKVIYIPYPGAKKEEGVITSFNPQFVFVRYGRDVHSKATKASDLQYI